jgi:hypothetical protein
VELRKLNRFEKRKSAIEKAIREHIEQYKAIYKKADDEDRDPTDEERLDIESQLKAIETLKTENAEVEANLKTIQHVDDISRDLGPALGNEQANWTGESNLNRIQVGQGPIDRMVKSLGEQFTESKGFQGAYEQLKAGSKSFSTGAVELNQPGAMFNGTLDPEPAADSSRSRRSSPASSRRCFSR